MQVIRIGVLRSGRYRSGDGFQVYGDAGTGQVDWEHPVTPRRELLWPDVPVMVGHTSGGHLMGMHLDHVVPDGHLAGTHLLDEHLYPAGLVAFEAGPFVFGRFRHAVLMEDGLGNAELGGVTVHETVINSEPMAASELRPIGYEARTGGLTFAFWPSDRLIG